MPFFSRGRFFVYYYLLIREGNCYNEAPIGLGAIRANSPMIVGWEMHKMRYLCAYRMTGSYRNLDVIILLIVGIESAV